jgi:hypothetical protein
LEATIGEQLLRVGDSGLELYAVVAYPLPLGYLGRKILILNDLEGASAGKILIISRLFPKYLLSMA